MNTKLRFAFSPLNFIVFLAACAPGITGKAFSLPEYKVFEVTPVAIESSETFDSGVAVRITEYMKSRFIEEGFKVASGSEDAIIIKSTIIGYMTGNSGTSSCEVRSVLINKKTNKVLGEILTTAAISARGLTLIGVRTDDAILRMVADNIVAEIEKMLKHQRAFSQSD